MSSEQHPPIFWKWRDLFRSRKVLPLPTDEWFNVPQQVQRCSCGRDLSVVVFRGRPSVITAENVLAKVQSPTAAVITAQLPGVDVEEVMKALTDVPRRAKWEPHYRSYEIIEERSLTDILYHTIGLGPSVFNRGYMLSRCVTIQPDGYAIEQHSVEHPLLPSDDPALPRRATIFFQGTRLVASAADNTGGEAGVALELTSLQDSATRSMPTFLNNYLCSREPTRWVHALYHDVLAGQAAQKKEAKGSSNEVTAATVTATMSIRVEQLPAKTFFRSLLSVLSTPTLVGRKAALLV